MFFFHLNSRFVSVRHLLAPNDDGKRSQVMTFSEENKKKQLSFAVFSLLLHPPQIFVSRSYDATNHFEAECEDIKDMYRRITGAELCFRGAKRHQSHNSDEESR